MISYWCNVHTHRLWDSSEILISLIFWGVYKLLLIAGPNSWGTSWSFWFSSTKCGEIIVFLDIKIFNWLPERLENDISFLSRVATPPQKPSNLLNFEKSPQKSSKLLQKWQYLELPPQNSSILLYIPTLRSWV